MITQVKIGITRFNDQKTGKYLSIVSGMYFCMEIILLFNDNVGIPKITDKVLKHF